MYGISCNIPYITERNNNGTKQTIYNPVNLASMIKGMKNTTMTREQKIALRMEYEKKQSVN